MEHKSHKKLYKSGKLWVAATIATTALAGGLAVTQSTVNADTLNLTPVEKTADTQLPPVPETSYAKAEQQNVENTPAAELQATTKDQQDSDAKQAAVTKADDVVKKAQVVPEINVSDAYVKTVKQLEADLNAYTKDNPTRLNVVDEYAEGYGTIVGNPEISKLTGQQVAKTFLDSALDNHLLEVDKKSSENWNSTHYKVADYQGWSDKDKNTVVVDYNGQSSNRNLDKLTRDQKIELTTLAAALINQVRQQVGVTPLKVTDASIDLGDLIVNNSNVPERSLIDFKPLQQNINVYASDKYGLATYKTDSQEIQGSEIVSSYSRSDNRDQLTMADLKNGIYKAIVSSLFLGGGETRGYDNLLETMTTYSATPLLHDTFAIQKDGESVPTQMYLSLSLKAEHIFGTTSQRYGFNVFANASHRKDANVNGVVATKNLGKEYVATPLSGDKGNTTGANTNTGTTTTGTNANAGTTTTGANTNTDETTTTNGNQQSTGDTNEGPQEHHDQQPKVTVTDATNKGQVTVAKAGTKAVKSATTKQAVSAVKAQPTRTAQSKALPQTGNDNANASVLGLAGVAMLSMIGLAAKRKF